MSSRGILFQGDGRNARWHWASTNPLAMRTYCGLPLRRGTYSSHRQDEDFDQDTECKPCRQIERRGPRFRLPPTFLGKERTLYDDELKQYGFDPDKMTNEDLMALIKASIDFRKREQRVMRWSLSNLRETFIRDRTSIAVFVVFIVLPTLLVLVRALLPSPP